MIKIETKITDNGYSGNTKVSSFFFLGMKILTRTTITVR